MLNLPLSARIEAEPNNTNGTSTALADFAEGIYGDLVSGTDVDTYKVVLAAPTKLRAITQSLKTATIDGFFGPQVVSSDTVISIVDGVGDLVIRSSDRGFGEDVTTVEALATGTYYIQITQSTEGSFNADANDYGLFLVAVP